MQHETELHALVSDIMGIEVLSMGGAMPGIIGAAGSEAQLVNELKHAAIEYAKQYPFSAQGQEKLRESQDKIIGLLQTLQLRSTLSHETAERIIDKLLDLTDSA